MPVTGPQLDRKWKGKNAGGLKTAAEIAKQRKKKEALRVRQQSGKKKRHAPSFGRTGRLGKRKWK